MQAMSASKGLEHHSAQNLPDLWCADRQGAGGSMTEHGLTWTYQGKTINVGEDGLFGVTDGGWGYISLADARTDIDR